MKFSIIIPTHNSANDHLLQCVRSVKDQVCRDFEIIIVDDGSESPEISCMGVSIIQLGVNAGPGIARNAGLEVASGEWIIFLDSDDMLAKNSLGDLAKFIDLNPSADVVAYNWASTQAQNIKRRTDSEYLRCSASDRLAAYTSHHMDGSVIFTTFKREFIIQHEMKFRAGVHEDIDFIFFVYALAENLLFFDEIVYIKRDRSGSIINSIGTGHIRGYIEGWHQVMQFMYNPVGIIGAVATRIREIYRHTEANSEGVWLSQRVFLLNFLLAELPAGWVDLIRNSKLDTQYARIARTFLEGPHKDISALFEMKWSCRDLHGSLFLGPNEIRACCKRFFVDGEIRGDVVLLKADKIQPTHEMIIDAKNELIKNINRGAETKCDGCPFMEFKKWPEIGVKYISLEYSSVCNMRCTYCDEKYYGGEHAKYDVKTLLIDLGLNGSGLSQCHTIVWGGGEPTASRGFEENAAILNLISGAKHRFLTNATRHSKTIGGFIKNGSSITVSVDAGTDEMFKRVRGTKKGICQIFENIRKYAMVSPTAVTIKYILTDENHIAPELQAFVSKIIAYSLNGCNFQISSDFKHDNVGSDTMRAALKLYNRLTQVGCNVVFIDDLLYQRMIWAGDEVVACDGIESAEKYKDTGITLFGSGDMTAWLLTNTRFLKTVRVVARDEYVQGVPVLITGSQSYPEVYKKAIKLGVHEDMIIRGIIL